MTSELLVSSSKALHQKAIEIRRHLHENPELSFHEFETTKFIEEKLLHLGIEVQKPMETGCLGIIKAENPTLPPLALRADIDALPINEEGDAKAAFFSRKEGVAHCCGHDAHTTNLLIAAEIIVEHKAELNRDIVFIFQAGEEQLPGGGRLLAESGALQNLGVAQIFGLHTDPHRSVGKIGVRDGDFMACTSEFEIKVFGKGGHAAKPHQAIDSVYLAAQTIVNVQSVVSRLVNPVQSAVVTIGSIHGGSAHNVIPEMVSLKGTVRTFDEKLSFQMADHIARIAKNTAEMHGGRAEFVFNMGYPAVVNAKSQNDVVRAATKKILGDEALVELHEPVMGGEDFSFYLKDFDGAFFYLGSGSKDADSEYTWHHPKYNVDEACMVNGAALLAGLALGVGQ